ncbi:MAG: hypothetical protein ACLFTA_01530 [Candidatus Nanohaloarchaea archaeon]
MLIEASAFLGFISLGIASVYDLKSEKGDVPASILLFGIASGLILHLTHSIIVKNPEAFYTSILVGSVFTAYGFISYIMDMWGGADMLGISVLGFSSTYFLIQMNGILGVIDLFINMMAVAFVYALLFGAVKGLKDQKTRKSFKEKLGQNKLIAGFLVGIGFFFPIAMNGNTGWIFLSFYEFMVFVYFFFQSVEEEVMTEEISIEELEIGDVVSFEGVDLKTWKKPNILGKTFSRISETLPESRVKAFIEFLNDKYGYSEIVGLTEEGLETLRNSEVEKVEVKDGIRFMPVFPVALALTIYGVSVLRFLIYSV